MSRVAIVAIAAAAVPAQGADSPYRAQLLSSFSNPLPPNSAAPNAPVLASDGRLYVTVGLGGANGTGAIYRVEANTSVTLLYSFSAVTGDYPRTNADGAYPYGKLVQGKDGALYGSAYGGGIKGSGTVFRISTGGQFSVLHSFSALDPITVTNDDGAWPQGALAVAPDGTLYGTTSRGGNPNGGTAFKLAEDGSGFAVLHAFGPDEGVYGAFPSTDLIYGSDGKLYGLTQYTVDSNATQGTVFSLSSSGAFSPVYRFPGYVPGNSLAPSGGLVEGADGGLYGAASNNGALLYRIGKDGSYKELHRTGSNSILDANPDGSQYATQPLLPLANGSFYGLTSGGGPFNGGSVFHMTADGSVHTLYFTGDSAQGANNPVGLTFGADGALYGSAGYGGSSNQGGLFRLPLPPPAGWGEGAAPIVRASLAPTIVHLNSASKSATLKWTSEGATACIISASDGMTETVTASNGSISIKPAITEPGVVKYYISCTGSRQGSTIVPLLVER